MKKYFLLSIPILLALIVGLIAYAVALAVLDPPSEEDIRNAPEDRTPAARATGSDEATAEGEDFMKEWKKHWEAKQKSGTVEEETESVTEKSRSDDVKPVAKKPTKGKLRVERHNAYVTARKTGAIAFLITAGVAYVGLAVYAAYLSRKRPKTTWRDAVAPGPGQGTPDVTSAANTGYDDDSDRDTPPEPQPDLPARDIDDQAPFEPYEPPVDISEIEKAHDEDSRDA